MNLQYASKAGQRAPCLRLNLKGQRGTLSGSFQHPGENGNEDYNNPEFVCSFQVREQIGGIFTGDLHADTGRLLQQHEGISDG